MGKSKRIKKCSGCGTPEPDHGFGPTNKHCEGPEAVHPKQEYNASTSGDSQLPAVEEDQSLMSEMEALQNQLKSLTLKEEKLRAEREKQAKQTEISALKEAIKAKMASIKELESSSTVQEILSPDSYSTTEKRGEGFDLHELRKLFEGRNTELPSSQTKQNKEHCLSDLLNALDSSEPASSQPAQERLDQDPMVFLRPPNKTGEKYLKIVDFVYHTVPQRDEHLVNEHGDTKLVLTSSQRKPRLENITIQQWVIGSNRILFELISTNKLPQDRISDYLAYNVKVMELAQRFEWKSVLKYDDEYRYLQAAYSFRWGSDSQHFHTVLLTPLSTPSRKQSTNHPLPRTMFTTDGIEVCRKFNSRDGCHFPECKYKHCCSKPNCQGSHPIFKHSSAPASKSD